MQKNMVSILQDRPSGTVCVDILLQNLVMRVLLILTLTQVIIELAQATIK